MCVYKNKRGRACQRDTERVRESESKKKNERGSAREREFLHVCVHER